MKIGICDDSARDMAQIKAALDGIKDSLGLEVMCFSSGEEIISAAIENPDFGLVILDIYMNGIDGIKTAYRLREIMPRVQLAFLTSDSGYAVDAFDLGALHYIIKPVTREKLEELMERFSGRVHRAVGSFELKSRTRTYTFPILQVQKLASSNKGVDVYLKNGDTVHIPESFAAIEEQLDPSLFLKISRGLAVNMSYIHCMTGEICRFKDGTEALISRRDRSDIRRRYNDYLFEGQEGSYDGD